MALQASGQISLNDLRNEFGQPAGETKMSTYRKKIPSTYFFAYKYGTEAQLDGQLTQTLLEQNTTYYIFVPPSDTGTWTITDSGGTAITTGISGNGATAGGVITINTASYSGGDVIGYVRSSECTTFNYYLEVTSQTSTGVQTSLWNENYFDIVCNPNFLGHSSTTLLQSGAYYTCPDYSTTSNYLYPGVVKNGQSISMRVNVTSGFNETPVNSYMFIAIRTYNLNYSNGAYSAGSYVGQVAWRNNSSYLGPSYNPNTASGIQTVLHNPNWSLNYGSGWTMSQPSSTASGTVITFTNNTGSDRWVGAYSNGGKWNHPFGIQFYDSNGFVYGTNSWTHETQKYGAPYKYGGTLYVQGYTTYTIPLGNNVVHNEGDSGATSQADKIKELLDNSSYAFLYTTSKPNASTVRVTLKSGPRIRPSSLYPNYYYLPGTNTTLIGYSGVDLASNLGFTNNSYGAPSNQATGIYINNSGNIKISEFYSVQDNPTLEYTQDFLIGA